MYTIILQTFRLRTLSSTRLAKLTLLIFRDYLHQEKANSSKKVNSNMILIFSSLVSVLCLSAPWSVSIASGQVQTTDAIRTLQGGDDGQCPSIEERERTRSDLSQIVASVIATMTTTTTPARSTTVGMPTEASVTTMPSMTGTYTCNGTPGWRRVAFINMTDTSYNCPTGLNLTSYSKRTCGRSHTSPGCSSTTFSVGGLPYSRVCGRIRGYQFGATDAFRGSSRSIDSYYVEGVSLTHGGTGSRQHIWTLAAGISEVTTRWPNNGCPCDTAAHSVVPSFVGNDYFCESGVHSEWNYGFILYSNDTLWDGHDCTSTSTCCQFNSPPWFTKNLPTATTDDIELRICVKNTPSIEDVPLELIELYVQ